MHTIGTKNDICLYGGSFDPVHIGHLNIIHELERLSGIRKLVLIPAYCSNFKQSSHPAVFQKRLEMLALALSDYRKYYPDSEMEITISDIEGKRKGISYTSDTVRYFLDAYSSDHIYFLIGDDLLSDLEKWHDFDFLKDHVTFICLSRYERESEDSKWIVRVKSRMVDASSSDVRKGNTLLLSPLVREYVMKNNLYMTDSGEYRKKIKKEMKETRYLHTLGVEKMAISLARRFSLDEKKASLSALHHDRYRYIEKEKAVKELDEASFPLFDEERENDALLHAPYASLKMSSDIPFSSSDMHKAVRYHTLGSFDMGRLGAAIYIADYAEEGRKHLDEKERKKILSFSSLEEMVLYIIRRQEEYFSKKGIRSAAVTKCLKEYLENGGKFED